MRQAALEAVRPKLAPDGLLTLEAMASMASLTGSVVHVVVDRGPGLVERAESLAQFAGIDVTVDLSASSVHVRFDGRPRNDQGSHS